MKVAFDFDNVLADQGAGRPHRYFVMRELWKALHAAKHILFVFHYISPSDYTPSNFPGKYPTKAAAFEGHQKIITYAFDHYLLPKPHGVFFTTKTKQVLYEAHRPDLVIDDMTSWTRLADEKGITALRLL